MLSLILPFAGCDLSDVDQRESHGLPGQLLPGGGDGVPRLLVGIQRGLPLVPGHLQPGVGGANLPYGVPHLPGHHQLGGEGDHYIPQFHSRDDLCHLQPLVEGDLLGPVHFQLLRLPDFPQPGGGGELGIPHQDRHGLHDLPGHVGLSLLLPVHGPSQVDGGGGALQHVDGGAGQLSLATQD